MAQGDPKKWSMPGWRIEQRFSPGVLIGNWSEERNIFQRGNNLHNSTHRTDFRNWGGHRPDVVIRRNAMMRSDGLGPETLFHHHGKKYSNNMVSWYDEQYNGRWHENCLPELRNWNGHCLAWVPEKSDHPLQGQSTNYGLLPKLQREWKQQICDETKGDYLSTYQNSFISPPKSALVTLRNAVPKPSSTSVHSITKINKNLDFRNDPTAKGPELSGRELTTISC
ncbi:cilia- and flagella-associated protein 107 [Patella vulgata]|uniref:cilia- and flagella-associated protein 107 n=1 Tax=Patella vulgata TaxID=6465 RepID=UPI00217F66E2|nr:cilia- and flagella-associated protein 107 [Patella vulgata]